MTEYINDVHNELSQARGAIEGAMRIADLWRPGEEWKGGHEGEAVALESMYKLFQAVLASKRHMHVNNGTRNDACKLCGLDLRNPIHLRLGEKAGAT